MCSVMDQLSRTEVAERAGVAPEFIDRLVELSIVIPTDGMFRLSDVYRARLVKGFDDAGLSLDDIGAVVAAGKFSFAFMDFGNWRWAPRSAKSYRQVAAESGLSVDLLASIQEALGYERPDPDDLMRDDDLEAMPLIQMAIGVPVPEKAMLRLVRMYGDAFRQFTEGETNFFHTFIEGPLMAGGSTPQTFEIAQQAGEQFTPFLERFIQNLYRRYQERAWTEDVMEHVETALEEMGLTRAARPPAICFLDLAGYTRLTEERGDRAAAELAAELGEMVQRTSHGHGGRPVKWLGDGVMFFFRDPAPAVTAALEMVERAPAAGLLPAHAGVAAGPVVTQGGDYFGRTVNMAARIAGQAVAGQTLVSDTVMEACEGTPLEFREIGMVELKGVPKPVRLHEAGPAGGDPG
jgi:adenylate cyclase